MLSPHAIISKKAKIAENVTVEAFSIIGDDVEIGEGTWIGPHVTIKGPTKIGANNKIYQYSSIGEITQDKKFKGEVAYLEIGDNNVFREFCTINKGAQHGGLVTSIGSNNLFMSYTHVAHDCKVGNENVFSNNASLAGHVIVGNKATLGGMSGVAQFCKLGDYSFVGAGSIVTKDVPPFIKVSGYPAKYLGINHIALERSDFSDKQKENITKAYKLVYRSKLTIDKAILEVRQKCEENYEINLILSFLEDVKKGVIR